MTPQRPPVHLPPSSMTAQKAHLIYKLFLLENVRNTLEQELQIFTNKAYEEVQGFLSSSISNSVFIELTKALDEKCQTMQNLSALLKDVTCDQQAGFQPTVKIGVRTSQLQPLTNKGILMTNVLKFGPMVKNSLMAGSIAKAVQVLGATLSLQQLKLFLTSQPAAVQQDDMITTISSNVNSSILTTSTPYSSNAKEQQAILDENSQPDSGIVPPAITQSCKISSERPLLLPPIQAILPEISNPKPMSITPLISWGHGDDGQVQHQKQTSSQLLRFLREKAKNTHAFEDTIMEWAERTPASDLQQLTSPTIQTLNYQFRHVEADDLIAPKALHMNIENQAPVFRLKRAESSGSLIYSCVITTETELWDIGDILTEKSRNVIPQVENSCENIHGKTQTLQCTEPKHENLSTESKVPVNIPQFQTRRFEETEIVVSHIVSPSNFYIQHADSPERLQSLVTDSWKASSSYAELNCIPDLGTLVMAWFPKQEQWCRAQVMKICGVSRENNAMNGGRSDTSIKVEVKRLDHGDTACLSLWNMKELTQEMAVLPLQAVQVSLANVTPVNGSHWSEESLGWFKAMVHNRMLYARLYPQGLKMTVELFLEKEKLGAMRRGASLSLRLAQNGHAKHAKLKNTGLLKRSTVQQDSDWEKYLISCYIQRQK